jgi:endonuclease I
MNFLGLFSSLFITSGVALGGVLNSKNLINRASAYQYDEMNETQVKNYYSSTIHEGDSKDQVLSKLETLLKSTHTKTNYSSGSSKSANWNGYYLFERNFELSPLSASERSGNYKTSGIWLNVMYCNSPIYVETSITYNKTYKYYDENGNLKSGAFQNSKTYLNREHVWAKSHGFDSNAYPYSETDAGCDIHNLHMSDEINNERHSNHPYAELTTYTGSTQVMDNFTGQISGYVGQHNGVTVYDPLDKDKGIIARSILYMAVRYHTFDNSTSNLQPALALTDNLTYASSSVNPEDTSSAPAYYGHLSTLLKRNKEHPVTDAERYRNTLIYKNFQHNRNPFVDYPHWADFLFGNTDEFPDGLTYTIPETYQEKQYKVYLTKGEDFKSTYNVGDTLPSTSYAAKVLDLETSTYLQNPTVVYKINGEAVGGDYKITKEGENSIQAFYTSAEGQTFSSNIIYFNAGTPGTDPEKVDPIDFIKNNSTIIIVVVAVIALLILLIIIVAATRKKAINNSVPKSKSYKGFENKVLSNKQIKNIKSTAKKALKTTSNPKKKKK